MRERTPGPWKHEGRYVYAPGPNGANICVVSSPRGSEQVGGAPVKIDDPDLHEAYANARLIAAAPSHETRLREIADFVASDVVAASYQTIGQYRSVLLRMLAAAVEADAAHPTTEGVRDE